MLVGPASSTALWCRYAVFRRWPGNVHIDCRLLAMVFCVAELTSSPAETAPHSALLVTLCCSSQQRLTVSQIWVLERRCRCSSLTQLERATEKKHEERAKDVGSCGPGVMHIGSSQPLALSRVHRCDSTGRDPLLKPDQVLCVKSKLRLLAHESGDLMIP